MSRPGFVFDLTTDRTAKTIEYRCRTCGLSDQGAAVPDRDLQERMMRHVREAHALADPSGWKITRQDRNETEAMICFWPPEAL